MRDGYFYRSLLNTLIVYLILASALIAFVVIAGFAGFLAILIVIVLLLIYFYTGFRFKSKD